MTTAPKISGFSMIRNAVLMGYPIVESILSILPLVDEFVIGVGQGDDGTKDLILSLNNPKIRVFDTFWDTTKTKGGLILSEKTNEALDACTHDWCLYLQADEVLHEEDCPAIRAALAAAAAQPEVEGLLFRYKHFYGSYDVVATSRKWYRNEVRMVRRSSGIRSVNDAQGFRVEGRKPAVLRSGASVFHYGWVKPPKLMGEKSKLLSRWWHGNKLDQSFEQFEFDRQYGLRRFEGTHPAVMRDRVSQQNWQFDPRRRLQDWKFKDLNLCLSDTFERVFHYRIGEYKPYKLIHRINRPASTAEIL